MECVAIVSIALQLHCQQSQTRDGIDDEVSQTSFGRNLGVLLPLGGWLDNGLRQQAWIPSINLANANRRWLEQSIDGRDVFQNGHVDEEPVRDRRSGHVVRLR
jgi:hypothetical protein